MATIQHAPVGEHHGRPHGGTHDQIDAISWGLFFIWMGVGWLVDVGWGAWFIGVGLITLAAEAAHVVVGGIKPDLFWTIVGLLFLLGGVWVLFDIQFEFVPIVVIAAGIVVILSALRSRSAS